MLSLFLFSNAHIILYVSKLIHFTIHTIQLIYFISLTTLLISPIKILYWKFFIFTYIPVERGEKLCTPNTRINKTLFEYQTQLTSELPFQNNWQNVPMKKRKNTLVNPLSNSTASHEWDYSVYPEANFSNIIISLINDLTPYRLSWPPKPINVKDLLDDACFVPPPPDRIAEVRIPTLYTCYRDSVRKHPF